MRWTEARDFSEACASIRREALMEAALAHRAAQADANGWKEWMRQVTGQ